MDDLAPPHLLGLPSAPASGSCLTREAPLARPLAVGALDLAPPPGAVGCLIGIDAAALAVVGPLALLDLLVVDGFVECLGWRLLIEPT